MGQHRHLCILLKRALKLSLLSIFISRDFSIFFKMSPAILISMFDRDMGKGRLE